ncbi:MAG: polyprenyl synthetase family protein [Chlamydiota bacterium]|nr:polyprenyl synthetase family protein [Chlamydiota bacterium]
MRCSILAPYLESISCHLTQKANELFPGSPLCSPIRSSLVGGGLTRPLLSLLIGEGVGLGIDPIEVTLSVECFHAASLILDDLPCMDNAQVRRGKPSLHVAHGEGRALLTTTSLISIAYGNLVSASRSLLSQYPSHPSPLEVCLEIAARCGGGAGASAGQALDLLPPKEMSKEYLLQVISLKSAPFFEVAFLYGYLFGGGDRSSVEALIAPARDFALSHQLRDDLADRKEDKQTTLATLLPYSECLQLLNEAQERCATSLNQMGLMTPALNALIFPI